LKNKSKVNIKNIYCKLFFSSLVTALYFRNAIEIAPPDTIRRRQTSFDVQGTEPSFLAVIESTSSRKLVKEILIRVDARNTKGTGEWSEYYSFIAR
jgi:hypothetical protein